MASVLSDPRFHDEAAAYAWVEARLWPHGPVCPFCGSRDRIGRLKGKSTRVGVHKCYWCRKPFRVTVGTLFEASHIKLHLWLQAITLLSSSKKGISTHQLHRTLGIGLKAAWFLAQRIREAMRSASWLRWAVMAGSWRPTKPISASLRDPAQADQKRSSPPTKAARSAPAASAPSSRWSSMAAASAPSTSRKMPTRPPSTPLSAGTSLMKPGCIPTRAASTAMCASMSLCTSLSGTLAASMSAVMCTPTRPRATSACSSAG